MRSPSSLARAHARIPRAFLTVAAAIVLTFSAGGCSPAADAPWPTVGEAIDRLTKDYGYNFVPYQDSYRATNESRQLQISFPQDRKTVKQMRVGVYAGTYVPYIKDIDNVFDVIAPDGKNWSHDEENKTAKIITFQDTFDAKKGTITAFWNKDDALLVFIFNGD